MRRVKDSTSLSFPFALCLTHCYYTCTYLSVQLDLSATPVSDLTSDLLSNPSTCLPLKTWVCNTQT